jgi:UDP-2,3-diacylglucosamine hydrolase
MAQVAGAARGHQAPAAPMRETLFISDLHLSPARPDTTAALIAFLRGRARSAQALYILGDLFDYWIGDDDLDAPLHAIVADELVTLTASGVSAYLMHGNRDFLLGEVFAARTGVRLIADPTPLELNGVPTLLLHGDTLCSEDLAYNRFRATVRDPVWQQAFLARPLGERRAEAQRLRAISEQEKQHKRAEIMDVTPSEVLRALRAHGYPRIIHGHTHRPMLHRHPVDGRVCERWVLPDWAATAGAPAAGLAARGGMIQPFATP